MKEWIKELKDSRSEVTLGTDQYSLSGKVFSRLFEYIDSLEGQLERSKNAGRNLARSMGNITEPHTTSIGFKPLELCALMAEGEGPDEEVYRKMAKDSLDQISEALSRYVEHEIAEQGGIEYTKTTIVI